MADPQHVRRIAAALLPGEVTATAHVVHGEFHDVVLLPGRAVVKVARGRAADELRRRAALTGALARLDLPFVVPEPLTEVEDVDDCTAVALAWAPGAPANARAPGPTQLREVLAALAALDVTPGGPLSRWLDVPHGYAGRDRWPLLMAEVVARLPPDVQESARARVEAATALPPVAPSLVHGDLAGDNLRWYDDGTLAAVIDWDLASAWDPAVDAACLAWFGWSTVAAALDAETLARARTWAATFPLEHPASAIDNGESETVVTTRLALTARLLRQARGGSATEGL